MLHFGLECGESASLGNKISQDILNDYSAVLFQGIEGVDKDQSKAIELCREVAGFGNESAKKNLPLFLFDYAVDLFSGVGVEEKDMPKAIALMQEASTVGKGDTRRDFIGALGEFFNTYAAMLHGRNNIGKDIPRAIEFFRKSFELGDESAQFNFPNSLNTYACGLFHGGNGIEKDMSKAIQLFREAVMLGDRSARLNLPVNLNAYAVMFFQGSNGVEQNIPKAIELFQEAASLGNPDAIRMLASLNR